MASNRFVRAGDKLKRNLSASTWNSFVAATERVEKSGSFGVEQHKPIYQLEANQLTMLLRNLATFNADLHHVRSMDDPGILPSESDGDFANRVQMTGAAPDETDHGRFCIAVRGIPSQDIGHAAVSGVVSCMLQIPDNGDWLQWADIDPADATRLKATPSGTAQILWKEASTGVVNAVVRMGLPANRTHIGIVRASSIEPNSSGPIELYDGPNAATNFTIDAHLDWMTSNQAVTNGKQVLVTWFPAETQGSERKGLWRIVGAECEDGTGAPIERGYEGPDA